MTRPKKKPKVGDVVGWAIVEDYCFLADYFDTREQARENLSRMKSFGHDVRLAKVVLSK